ncbi:glycosyltransferase family 2 protein [Candidatus Pelagibacter sp.]|nr:glycosyltransferase family 2 protein [Candidatus Pelagibacter sp.]
MKISIIIPCFNEEKTISTVINNILSSYNGDKEIIVIDDFSNDKTRDIIQSNLKDKIDKIILNEKNYGKGFSIRKGINVADGEVIIIQDADLEYDPSDYNKLLKPIKNGVADVVYGSRFLGGEQKRVLYFWHTLGNKFLTLLSNMFSNLNLTDMEVGYKLFKSKIIRDINLSEDRFGFEPEITAKIAKKNVRIFEVGISYNGRKYEDGKKITWKDGISAIRCIIKYNIFN